MFIACKHHREREIHLVIKQCDKIKEKNKMKVGRDFLRLYKIHFIKFIGLAFQWKQYWTGQSARKYTGGLL